MATAPVTQPGNAGGPSNTSQAYQAALQNSVAGLTYGSLLNSWSQNKIVPAGYFYDQNASVFFGPPNYSTVISPRGSYTQSEVVSVSKPGQRVPRSLSANTPGTNAVDYPG
jgi:hypothetical protein